MNCINCTFTFMFKFHFKHNFNKKKKKINKKLFPDYSYQVLWKKVENNIDINRIRNLINSVVLINIQQIWQIFKTSIYI